MTHIGLEISKIYKLNKFHEDWMIIVASIVLASKLLTTDERRTMEDRQKAITKTDLEHLVLWWAKNTEAEGEIAHFLPLLQCFELYLINLTLSHLQTHFDVIAADDF